MSRIRIVWGSCAAFFIFITFNCVGEKQMAKKCGKCNGTGKVNCPRCKGRGTIIVNGKKEKCDTCSSYYHLYQTGRVTCHTCDGTGVYSKD